MDTYEQKRKERKSQGASFGHIKRRILRNEPLTGKTLELALEQIENNGNDEFSRFLNKIAEKLKAGQPLDDYEIHIMCDMVLLHARLFSVSDEDSLDIYKREPIVI